jgi:molecular chaperone DnaK (HSP70)
MSGSPIIGIDFGTKYSCVSVYHDNNLQIIDYLGDVKILNNVKFDSNEYKIGDINMRTNYKKTIYNSKIFLASDKNSKFANEWRFPFEVLADENSDRMQLKLKELKYEPEEITSIFLKKCKEISTKYTTKDIKDAVITVPASFNDSQRQALIDSAEIAGFNTITLLNDSTASALAFAYNKNIANKSFILSFDLGAYYLNLSLFSVKNGKIQVHKSASYPESGGIMFDCKIAKYVIKNTSLLQDKEKLEKSQKFIQILLNECEKAKKILSNTSEAYIDIDDDSHDISCKLTRKEFEDINNSLFEKLLENIEDFFSNLTVDKSKIEEVVLFGGSSRMPRLQSLLKEYFVNKHINNSMNASESVAFGAGLFAACSTGFMPKNNFGFDFEEPASHQYSLEIFLGKEKHCELSIRNHDLLPSSQRVSLDSSAINDAILTFKIDEDERTIFERQYREKVSQKLEINLYVSKNGIVRLNLKNCDATNLKTQFFEEKMNCLNTVKINELKEDYKQYEKEQGELNKNLEMKNNFEKNCYELKEALKDIGFKNNIDTVITLLLEKIRASKYNDVTNKLHELNSLFEMEKRQRFLNKFTPSFLASKNLLTYSIIQSQLENFSIEFNQPTTSEISKLKKNVDTNESETKIAFEELRKRLIFVHNRIINRNPYCSLDLINQFKDNLDKISKFLSVKHNSAINEQLEGLKNYDTIDNFVRIYEKNAK